MPIYNYPDRLHGNQINEVESELTKFLKNINKNPKENYLAASVILMSSLDINQEMKNPNSPLRIAVLAAFDEQFFQELYTTVILPAMEQKRMELLAELVELEVLPEDDYEVLPPRESLDFRGLNPAEVKKLETALDLFAQLNQLQEEIGDLKLQRQNIIVDGYEQKVNFLKAEMQKTLAVIEAKLATMAPDDPNRVRLEVTAKQVHEILGNLEISSKKISAMKSSNVYSPEETAKLGQELEKTINSPDIPKVLDNAYGKEDSAVHKQHIRDGLDDIGVRNNAKVNIADEKLLSAMNEFKKTAIEFDKRLSEVPKLEGLIKDFDDKKKHEIKALIEDRPLDNPSQKYQHS